ncbi:hypothetical protein D9M68_18970 [compost metagenome]
MSIQPDRDEFFKRLNRVFKCIGFDLNGQAIYNPGRLAEQVLLSELHTASTWLAGYKDKVCSVGSVLNVMWKNLDGQDIHPLLYEHDVMTFTFEVRNTYLRAILVTRNNGKFGMCRDNMGSAERAYACYLLSMISKKAEFHKLWHADFEVKLDIGKLTVNTL